MKHPFRWIAVVVAAGVCVLAVVLATTVTSDPHKENNTSRLVGKRVPPFSVVGLDGKEITSESLAGKTVLVNFWNSWCLPCDQEYRALADWYQQNQDSSDVVLLGIVREDTKARIRDAVKEKEAPIEWPVTFDPGAKAALDFGTRGQPETYAIGPDGVVAASQFGPVSVGVLDQMVAHTQGRA